MALRASRKKLHIPHARDLPLVLVEWEDAWVKMEFDGAPEDAPTGVLVLHTAGYLLKKTPQVLTLALERAPEENTVRYVLTIPRKMVRDITPLQPCPPSSAE